ncbi:unnamed protein product [Periconia digitata]|uniref:Uncharacterized protein n=1 Tax=Periconia digitata TaxID=1303443 RepID=A0A9W4UJX8_9PLEO|nr:unnamed protein product [Periconia digitata]
MIAAGTLDFSSPSTSTALDTASTQNNPAVVSRHLGSLPAPDPLRNPHQISRTRPRTTSRLLFLSSWRIPSPGDAVWAALLPRRYPIVNNPSRTTLPNSTASSHAHIQLVSRPATDDDTTTSDYAESDSPSYCSPSLQSSLASSQTLRHPNPVNNVKGTSFADMARRFLQDDRDPFERPALGPPATAKFMSFTRNRHANKNWRQVQFGGALGIDTSLDIRGGGAEDSSSSPADSSDAARYPDSALPSKLQEASLRSFPSGHFTSQPDETSMRSPVAAFGRGPPPLPGLHPENVSPAVGRAHADPLKYYTQVFGELPDLIHISEQTGQYDGQVVFIGHPNRNVSAHQWFAEPFQWVSVGTWNHLHQKIEGSLASDPLSTIYPHNSIEQFKYLAQGREKRLLEAEPTKEDQQQRRATISSSDTPSTSTRDMRKLGTKAPNGSSPSQPSYSSVVGQVLEDPFVTPARPRTTMAPLPPSDRNITHSGFGTMNFNYEFPAKPTPSVHDILGQNRGLDSHQSAAQNDRLRSIVGRGIEERERSTPPGLGFRDGEKGEGTGGAPSVPAAQLKASGAEMAFSLEELRKLKTKLTELGDPSRQTDLPAEQRVTIPDMPMPSTHASLRSLFPPGPTVANPYRGTSTLNAQAPPYIRRQTTVEVPKASAPAANPVTDVPTPSNLNFSDPDGVSQRFHEIANGYSRQKPTPQTFKGPFFTESQPTTNDLTASLTVPTSKEEKLANWFRDGQRPQRQTAYAQSLVAAAVSNDKRNDLGVIGQAMSTQRAEARYANTPMFVRVYENLFEYADSGSSSSSFTKAWKPAPQSMCDTSPEGNSSFFSQDKGLAASGAPTRSKKAASPRLVVPWQVSPWGRAPPRTHLEVPGAAARGDLIPSMWAPLNRDPWQ